MFNYKKKVQATISYKSVQKSVVINEETTIYQLKAKFEVKCNFNLSKFKLIHVQSGSDIQLLNDNLKVIDHYGEEGFNNLLFELKPKENLELYFLKLFEKEYFKQEDLEKNKDNEEKKNNSLILPDINKSKENNNNANLGKDDFENKGNQGISNINNVKNDRYLDICFWDKKSKSSYICTKCRQEYCRECIKYEPHQKFLIEKVMVDSYCKANRENYKKEIKDQILIDKHYKAIERIDFILNDKLKLINDQFDESINVINRIRETQTKFLMDLYYQYVLNNKYKEIVTDIDYFNGKYKEIESRFMSGNSFINENLDNLKTLEKFKTLILENYKEFSYKYDIFDNMYNLYENFNSMLLNNLELKLKSSNDLRKNLIDPEKLKEEASYSKAVEEKKENVNIVDDAVNIYKVNYYNSILCFNNMKMNLKKEFNFSDKSEFKINYQLYDGNVFLNIYGKLFVLTGQKFNMMYMYDPIFNEVFQFSNLNENHCRGALIHANVNFGNNLTKNYILAIGGKLCQKCEFIEIDNFNLDKKVKGNKQVSFSNNNQNQNQNTSGKTNLDNDNNSKTSSKKSFFNKQPKNTGMPFSFKKKDESAEKDKINASLGNSNYLLAKWNYFDSLNDNRSQFAYYIYNQRFVYVFFGMNSKKGFLETIERCDLVSALNKKENKDIKDDNKSNINFKLWEEIAFKNPKQLMLGVHSMGICRINPDEVLILGGIIRGDKPTDKCVKFNFSHNSIFLNSMKIPEIESNEYYRFWEETNFIPLKDLSGNYNTNDDFYYGMFDAKNKFHLFNIKTFEYRIIEK